jgi:ribonuclease BN (tRNA processing enzyme)
VAAGAAPAGARMVLTIVGCSGSFPSPDSPASCYLVEVPQPGTRPLRVLLDLGNGALGPLQRLVDLHDLDAVLLSHLHPDHFLDACGLYVALKYDPVRAQERRLPVFGPPGTLQRLLQAYGSDATHLDAVYDVREWSDGRPVELTGTGGLVRSGGPAGSGEVGGLQVTPLRVNHPVESYGLRLEAGGAVLAYTGDTDSCPALQDLARDADVLLAEASFQEDRDPVRDIHLTGLRAGKAASEAGARRLLLTHLPVWTDPDVVREEAAGVFDGPLDVVAQGGRYEL